MKENEHEQAKILFRGHERSFETNTYVYPVVSRRSRGLSIGVNLSPTMICNYRCVYCQIEREEKPSAYVPVDLAVLRAELEEIVPLAADGRIFDHPQFASTPAPLRRFNDIAFSGAGEPTMCREFREAVDVAADVRDRLACPETKLVLITNATMLDRPEVRKTLNRFSPERDEIWAKLDAGTQSYHRKILRSQVPLEHVVNNMLTVGREHPIVVQTLFMLLDGAPPSNDELEAYIGRLRYLLDSGAKIDRIQIHTVARRPAESYVAALSDEQVDSIVAQVAQATGLVVEGYHG